MWILGKQLRSRVSRAELETRLMERTTALEKLSQQLLKVQDEERRKIARDLHDVAGQTLAALKMALADLEEKLHKKQSTESVLCDLGALTDQALLEIRTTSHLLHPPLLDELGFSAAAQWYVEGFAKRSGIKASMDFGADEKRLPIEIETALFRVLQEGLTNVHRYSGSSDVSVRFEQEEEAVVLEITDSGCGIPVEILQRLSTGCANGSGVGLAGMRERLGEFRGKMEINSSALGTTLRATVPLRENALEQCRKYLPFGLPTAARVEASRGISL